MVCGITDSWHCGLVPMTLTAEEQIRALKREVPAGSIYDDDSIKVHRNEAWNEALAESLQILKAEDRARAKRLRDKVLEAIDSTVIGVEERVNQKSHWHKEGWNDALTSVVGIRPQIVKIFDAELKVESE